MSQYALALCRSSSPSGEMLPEFNPGRRILQRGNTSEHGFVGCRPDLSQVLAGRHPLACVSINLVLVGHANVISPVKKDQQGWRL